MTEPSELKRKAALEYIENARDAPSANARLEKMKQAEALLLEALEINPKNHRARFLLVSTAMSIEDFARAKKEGIEIYNSLSQEQRRKMADAVLHISLTHASKMLGDMDDALKYCLEAAELFPDDPHPHMILGELYEAKEQHSKAERKCHDALQANDAPNCKHPLNSQSLYFTKCCLGAVLMRQDKYAESEKYLKNAQSMKQPHTLAMRYLVDCYECQGRHDEALHLAEEILAQDPSDDDVRGKIEAKKKASSGKADKSGYNSDTDVQTTGYKSGYKSDKSDKSGYNSDGRWAYTESGGASHSEDITVTSKKKSNHRGRSGESKTSKERSQSSDDKDSFLCCCFDKDKSGR